MKTISNDFIVKPEAEFGTNPASGGVNAVLQASKPKLYALPAHVKRMLQAALDAPDQSRQTVAIKLGCSRTAVSLLLSDQYPAKTDKMVVLIVERLGHVKCPHLDQQITGIECRGYYDRNAPTSSPLAMRHWRACQTCPNNLGTKS